MSIELKVHNAYRIFFCIPVNGGFPERLSLNSVNRVKIQKWYGYQSNFMSDNRYIPRCSGKKIPSLLFSEVNSLDLPRDSNGNIFLLLPLVMYLLPDG